MSTPILSLYLFCFSLVLTLLLTSAFRALAHRYRIVNIASRDRFETRRVPLLGGAAVFLSIWFTVYFHLGLIGWLYRFGTPITALANILSFYPEAERVMPQINAIFLGSAVIFVMGLVDDVRNLKPLIKLGVEACVCWILFMFGFKISFLYSQSILSYVMTAAWIILIINAFNLLDNMDSLSSGVAIIISAAFLLVAVTQNQSLVAFIIVAFLGAVTGFLPFNFPPARIFLGDAGSLTLGYFLAFMSLALSYYQEGVNLKAAVFMPLMAFAVPIYDTLSVIFIRLRNHKSIFKGDRNHFSHRLFNLGLGYRGSVCLIFLLTLSSGLLAYLITQVDMKGALVLCLNMFTILNIIAILEVYSARAKKKRRLPKRRLARIGVIR